MSTVNEVRDMIDRKRVEKEAEENAQKERARLAEIERFNSLANPFSKEETEELITNIIKSGGFILQGKNEKVTTFIDWFNKHSPDMKIINKYGGVYYLSK
jgi:hypothetical protein